ncbi:hypothetical protein Tco_0534754 [Tanacetum coccineum]
MSGRWETKTADLHTTRGVSEFMSILPGLADEFATLNVFRADDYAPHISLLAVAYVIFIVYHHRRWTLKCDHMYDSVKEEAITSFCEAFLFKRCFTVAIFCPLALAPLVPDSTSWTNRNPGRRFYGCPTLSPTCVNFLRWYDPPMCQRSVQIIPGLLRSRNELEEILAMVEENRCKLLTFLIISWTQREAQQANKLSNLTRQRQLLASVNYRRAIIQELKRLPINLVACKMREHLKYIQKAVFVEVIELKKELRL